MGVGAAWNAFLYLRLGLSRKRIRDHGEVLGARRRNLREVGRVEPFAVAGTQGQSTDPLGVKRLPTDGELRPLRVIPSAYRRLKWEDSSGRNVPSVLAEPVLALGKIEFETVSAGEIPSRAGDGNTDLLVH